MAATAPIVLSSSPSHSIISTTPSRALNAAMSSSPGLPSPSQLFNKTTSLLATSEGASPALKGPALGFIGASSLLRQVHSQERPPSPPIARTKALAEKRNRQSCDKSSTKREKGAIQDDTDGTIRKKPRAPRKKAVAEEGGQNMVVTADTSSAAQLLDMSGLPAVKTSQAKKTQNEGQTKIKKARITKPGATKDTAKVKKSARNPRSKQAAEGTERINEAPSKGEKASKTDDESLNLSEAVRRRRDWTPIEDTVPKFKFLEQDTASPEVSLVVENFPQTDSPAGLVENLMGDFGYAQQDSLSIGDPKFPQDSNGKGLTKRRKVELVDTTIYPPAQPSKAKRSISPKKKPQTITEKATAPFFLARPQPATSLLQYFPASAPLDNIHAVSQDLADTVPATKKRQRKSPVKKATTKKAKKQISDAPILLSPELAIKTATDQDVVFGTSSQLAGGESPTFIRDLRKAMEASESTTEPALESSSTSGSVGMLSGSSARSNVTSYVTSRNLWSIASRDAGGSLLNPEFVNLADTPKLLKTRTIEDATLLPNFVFLDAQRTSIEANAERDVAKDALNPIEKGFLEAAPTTEQRTIDVEPIIYEHVAKLSTKGRFKSRSPMKRAKKNVAPDNSEPPQTRSLPGGMPNYQGFTTAELSKTVASYAFKPIKRREAMIALLERCWENKQRTVLQALPPNIKTPQQPNAETLLSEAPKKNNSPEKKKARKTATVSVTAERNFAQNASPKKPRGRPRKVSTDGLSPQKRLATTSRKVEEPPIPQRSMTPHLIDDISDSDSTPPTPSPPRRSSSKPIPHLPLSAQKSAKPATANPASTPPLSSPDILDFITQAITSATPTHNPGILTWHERILMYEPLIIEDLTRWLNEEGLGKVATDEEVGTAKVREWCERRGVCWAWRGGWRGNKVGRE